MSNIVVNTLIKYRSWTYQLKVTTQIKAVRQAMVYRQKADCIIQNGTPSKGGKTGRSGKCLQYRHMYKGDSRLCFCKEMFVEIAAVGTKSSMIDTCLTIPFVILQRYVLAASA